MKQHGSFIISLDFELMWGMVDCQSKDGYGETNVRPVPEVVHRMLKLFEKYGAHATFATVGMMMFKDTTELVQNIPEIHPSYKDKSKSPYENNYINEIQTDEYPLFFCPDLIDEIRKHKGMEIGTHTFSHYYCWEEGQTLEQFDADITKAVEVARNNGIELKSIVFPRNNVSKEHLDVAAKHGIECYRGNALKFFEEPKNKWHEILIRIARLVDTYINIGGHTSTPYEEIIKEGKPYNIRASRMLRPYYHPLSFLEGVHVRRIKKEIIHAAKHNEMYHLWWHPHNMGADMEKNLWMLENLLQCYKECHDKYGMQAYNMGEIKDLITNNK